MMRQLEQGQISAVRALRAAYPDAQIALIGAAALGLHIDLKWRGGKKPVLRTGPWSWRAQEFDQTVDAFVRGLDAR